MPQPYHQYVFRIGFLGFRYSGWQHQPAEKTVEGMMQKTMRFVMPGRKFKFLGAGRTDARVSAMDFAIQFILWGSPVESTGSLMAAVNANLPPDIRLNSLEAVPADFNAIRDSTRKTYQYYFATGPKPHPFCAPLLGYFPGPLDIQAMVRAAPLFKGTHDFSTFITRPAEATRRKRTVITCRMAENKTITASFFPEHSYFLEVIGSGFGRYQVRNMMAGLAALGRGEITENDLKSALKMGKPLSIRDIAPASGLHLVDTQFK
jgi:tRNA pseudouridine38-40 synthase